MPFAGFPAVTILFYSKNFGPNESVPIEAPISANGGWRRFQIRMTLFVQVSACC